MHKFTETKKRYEKMDKVMTVVNDVKSNINKEIVYSTIAASFLLGLMVLAANKSGIKIVKQVVSVAK